MEVEPKEVTVAELCQGYRDNGDQGVVAYGGELDVRPAYQREFIYDDQQQKAVIRSVLSGFPLNVMYWAVAGDGRHEVLDGQQRTLSLCRYINDDFAYDTGAGARYYGNLPDDVQAKIANYRLTIYVCDGTDSERLDWFKIINIAGERLTDQELRNAVYSGPWLADAKRHFSSQGCAAQKLSDGYVKRNVMRQELLEQALQWAAGSKSKIELYMAGHQHAENAKNLWAHFQAVVEWAQKTFPMRRKELAAVDWDALHRAHGDERLSAASLEEDVKRLMSDDEVRNKKGIYAYVLDGDQKHLKLRNFEAGWLRGAYERQGGKCAGCDEGFDFEDMHGDHIEPWIKGGKTEPDNLQMLCAGCNLSKGSSSMAEWKAKL